ncbi:MAG: DUF2339 domain-containing protein, partial [Sandaracinaceae bacterium]
VEPEPVAEPTPALDVPRASAAYAPPPPSAGASVDGASQVAAVAEPPAATPPAPPPAAAPPVAPAVAPPAPKTPIAWEQWIGVRGAAALGASILALAGVYFFEYSIEHGLITPAMRMVLGTLVGLGCVAASELRLRKTHLVLANWLTGAGIAILYVAFWAGTALYDLYPTIVAGGLMVAVTAAGVTLSIRRNSIPIAVLGLLGGFITPLALSTGEDHPIPLFGYLLLLDGALLWVAYKRRWPALALLCLFATGVYQYSWLLARLDEPRLLLGVAIVGVFTAVFAALPRLQKDGDAPAESVLWRLSRSAGVLIPLLFTVPLAIRHDLGQTFAATAVQLGLLCVAAVWVGLRHRSAVLPTIAALVAGATLFAWGVSHPPSTALEAWQLTVLGIVLALVFQGMDELSRRRGEELGAAPAGAMHASLLSLAALGGPFAEGGGPWPSLALLGVVGLLSARVAGAAKETETPLRRALPLVAAFLTALGLGLTLVTRSAEVSPSLLFGLCLLFAAAYQAGGVLPFRRPAARADGDHAAALLAVLLLPLLSRYAADAVVPSWVYFLAVLTLAALALFAAARRASAGWMVGALVMTALAGSLYVVRFANGPFDVVTLVGLFAAVAMFTGFPVLAPRALRDQPWSWRVAALAGPLHLLALRHVYLDVVGAGTVGVLPLVLAALSLGGAYAVRSRGPAASEAKKTAIVWLTATTAGFVTLAIPLQLENEWVTIGWALEAVAMLALYRRLDHAGLKYIAYALAGAVLVRLTFNPWVLDYHPRGSMRVLNWLSYTYLVPAVCLGAMWWLLREIEVPRRRAWERSILGDKHAVLANVAAAAAFAVVFAWINLTIFDWFAETGALKIAIDRLPARDLSLSIAWALYALALLGLGMWRRSGALRVTSLLLILLTIGKVFLYDLAYLADLYRVASLVGLAISLIAISILYRRFVFTGPEEPASAPPSGPTASTPTSPATPEPSSPATSEPSGPIQHPTSAAAAATEAS